MAAASKGGNWAKTMTECEDQIPWSFLQLPCCSSHIMTRCKAAYTLWSKKGKYLTEI